jgi:hypothetical protein
MIQARVNRLIIVTSELRPMHRACLDGGDRLPGCLLPRLALSVSTGLRGRRAWRWARLAAFMLENP